MATGRQATWLRVGGIPEEELCVGTAPPPPPRTAAGLCERQASRSRAARSANVKTEYFFCDHDFLRRTLKMQ